MMLWFVRVVAKRIENLSSNHVSCYNKKKTQLKGLALSQQTNFHKNLALVIIN